MTATRSPACLAFPRTTSAASSPPRAAASAASSISACSCTALLAHYTKRPVKIVRSRVESTMISSKRHPITTHVKTGATKDGKLVAAQYELTCDAGAYGSYGPAVIGRFPVHAVGPTIARTSVWTRYLLTPTTRCAARSADSACRRPPLSTRDRWTLWPRLCI